MKRLVFSIFALSTVLLLSCSTNNNKEATQDNQEATAIEEASSEKADLAKIYELKSGIITYTIESAGKSFERKMFFDDFGNKMLAETKSGMTFGTENFDVTACELRLNDVIFNYQIYNNDDVYTKYGMAKTAMKTRIPSDFDWINLDFSLLSDEKMQEFSITKEESKEMFLEKECDVYTHITEETKSKFLVWNNIWLYSEITEKGETMKMYALSIEENIEIPTDKFTIPKGYKLKDMTIIPDEKTVK